MKITVDCQFNSKELEQYMLSQMAKELHYDVVTAIVMKAGYVESGHIKIKKAELVNKK